MFILAAKMLGSVVMALSLVGITPLATAQSSVVFAHGDHGRTAADGNNGRPSDVYVSDITATSVTVHWDNPNSEPVTARLLLLRKARHGPAIQDRPYIYAHGVAGENRHTITGLDHGRNYEIRIALHWHEGNRGHFSANVSTGSFSTLAPSGSELDPDPTSTAAQIAMILVVMGLMVAFLVFLLMRRRRQLAK